MQSICNTRLVRPDTTDLHSVGGVGWSTVDEGGSDEGDDMMSSGEDEVTDKTFVAVYNEVPAEFFWFLVSLDKVCGRQTTKVTSY